MKKLKDLLLLVIAVIALAACENEPIDNKALTITDGKSEYSIGASEQTVTISFTTTDKWEAVVEDISEGTENTAADWISLSQAKGNEAGDYTIKITAARNSGTSRSALVSLVCKETIKIITIKQAGQSGGTVAKEIRFYSNGQSYSTQMLSPKRFSRPVIAGTKSNGYNSIFLQTDSKNRVTKATNEAQKVVMEFFYDTDIVTVNSNYDDDIITSVYEYKDGRITKAIDEGNKDTFKYTTDGYLKEYKTQDFVMDENKRPVFFDIFYEYTWSDGCFTKLNNYSTGNIYGDFNEQHTLEFLPDVSGISNICLSNILIDCDIWSIYRLAGKSCDRLISKMTRNGETTTYSYTFNGSGAVEKVNISNPTEGNTTIEIIY